MTYTVPPKPLPPKTRLERVTDADEIAAIERSGLGDPIGDYFDCEDGSRVWYSTADSLRQFRGGTKYKVKA